MAYYAVKEGRCKGIFTTWDECLKHTKGYSGAIYKKFTTQEDAINFVYGEVKIADKEEVKVNKDLYEFYVDGSYNPITKTVGYGLVMLKDNQAIIRDIGTFINDPNAESRNVTGEVKGSMKAMDIAVANGFKEVNIYYDYMGIEKWATGEWKANKELTRTYQEMYKLRSKQVKINFVKVKAHTGNKWNEEADRLAKLGAGVE